MSCDAFTIEAKGMQTKPTRFGQNNESVNCDLKLWNNIPILFFHMAQPFASYEVFFLVFSLVHPFFFRLPPPKMARCRGLWASDPCTLSADHSTWHISQINAKQLSQGTGNIRKSISRPCADIEELHSSGYERVLHWFKHIYDPKPGSDQKYWMDLDGTSQPPYLEKKLVIEHPGFLWNYPFFNEVGGFAR